MAPAFHVACLCAAWCRLCDEYAPVLDKVAASFRAGGVPLQVQWIDIEDEAKLVGDVDVETFPTLVIVTGNVVRFAGPVTPQAETLSRLLRATVVDAPASAPAPAVAAEVQAFADRLARRCRT
ncbi:MAG: thioredoxin family protein [Serpentinimonas sp.]|nr:MAG: thioredoxin [Comamonadaceae bacterium BICA1-1]MDO8274670.1 thioredoxin family protein [Serpentinimonas sp.]MDO9611157.1 thioredoxin family protein [Serpentinimonas sp.]